MEFPDWLQSYRTVSVFRAPQNIWDLVFGGKVCSKWRLQLPQAGLAGQIRQLRRKGIIMMPLSPFESGANTAGYVSDPEK